MKDITKLLRKGNITPRERVLLVIKNDAHQQKTGKNLVTEADIAALTINWNPSDYRHAQQYNSYLNIWNRYQELRVDMQTKYLSTQLTLSRFEHIASLFYHKKNADRMSYLEQIIPDEHMEEFRNYFLQHSGYAYDKFIHLHTFDSLPKSLKQDILLLDPEVEHEHRYLLDEEKLAYILTGKQTIDTSEVEALTQMIMESIPWGQEIDFSIIKISIKEVIFKMHFAGYPLLSFGKRLASRHNVSYANEDELFTELAKLSDLKYKLECVVRESIREGLFFTEYTPLCNSSGYTTLYGETMLEHHEIMRLWLKAKEKTTQKFNTFLEDGSLTLKSSPTRFFEVSLQNDFITGESLYQTQLRLPFVASYKEQVDGLFIFGYPYYLIHQSEVFENYQNLLAFKELSQKMSDLIEVNVSENVCSHLSEINESVNTLNFYLRSMTDHMDQIAYNNSNGTYRPQTFMPDPSLTLQSLTPIYTESLKRFNEDLKKIIPK